MTLPSTAIQRWDLSLGFNEFSLEMQRRKYIGHLVFPPLSVGEQSANFRRIKIESLLTPPEDTERAPKMPYPRDTFEWSQDSYATSDHGVSEVVDDRQIKMHRNEINAENVSRERAIHRVAQAYEISAAALAFDTNYFTGNYTTALSTPWTTKATAKPIDDIDAAMDAFVLNCGHEANMMIAEKTAIRAALRSDQIVDIIKYTGQLDDKTVARLVPQLEDLWQIDRIVVARAPVKNTAGHGQPPTLARIWATDKVLLCRTYDGADLEAPEPHLGRTIQWSEEAGPLPGADDDGMGVLIEEYREEDRRGSVIRARTDYVIKRLHRPAGYLITNVTA